jgi:uncharacterized protein (DUF4415 family)
MKPTDNPVRAFNASNRSKVRFSNRTAVCSFGFVAVVFIVRFSIVPQRYTTYAFVVQVGSCAKFDTVTQWGMPESEPRKLASYRLDAKLLTKLQDTAERTHRTSRQVLEMVVQRLLPFVESGFVDSPEGQRMLSELDESIQRGERAAATLRDHLRAKDGLPPEPKEKERQLAVFRVDGDLLDRVRAAAQKTGRNDRQVIEMCLRWGVPIAEMWMMIEPVFDQIRSDWTQLRSAVSGGTSDLSPEELETRLRETMFRTLSTVMPRLFGGALTPEEVDDLRAKMFGETVNKAAALTAQRLATKKPGQ